jgi:hypothetical protein
MNLSELNGVGLQGLDTIQFRRQLSRQMAHERQLDRCVKTPQCDEKTEKMTGKFLSKK